MDKTSAHQPHSGIKYLSPSTPVEHCLQIVYQLIAFFFLFLFLGISHGTIVFKKKTKFILKNMKSKLVLK